VSRSISGEVMSVGRDGASDAAAFIQAGIPAVEFGPEGGGHHGPEEWVSLSSLARYRRALGDFVRALPLWLEEKTSPNGELTTPLAMQDAVEGGLA
jgi:succinyl-diaminopimelate desuccinylase